MMKQRLREMWAMLTENSPWEHFQTVNDICYRNGTQVEPYDFLEFHRTAFRVDELIERTIDVFDKRDFK